MHWETDSFVVREEQPQVDVLQEGDILYAESIRSKYGKPLQRDASAFESKFEYLIRLHMGVYINKNREQIDALLPQKIETNGQQLVWHANYIDGGCGIWSLQQFQQYYKIIAVRRVINE